MKNSEINKKFISTIDPKIKESILINIANHYGVTVEKAYNEVTDEDAESIMDYVTGSDRRIISLYYNKFISNQK